MENGCVDPDGEQGPLLLGYGQLHWITGINIGDNGTVYLTESIAGTQNSVVIFERTEAGTDNSSGDMAGNSHEGAIKVGEKPDAIAVHSGTNTIYVANVNSNTISIIDGSANKVVKTVSSGGIGPMGLAVNTVNNKVYVANFESDSVSVLDGKTGEVLANITNINYHP